MNARRAHATRGMTLIEIMVVIAILGLMAAVISVSVVHQFNVAKVKKARIDCHALSDALELYAAKTGKYPDSATGLQALVQAKILKTVQTDPWGGAYRVQMSEGAPVVVSYGADGQPGGDDLNADLSSAEPAE